MVIFNKIKFPSDISLSFGDFKKTFAGHLTRLSEIEVKECYDIVNNGKLSDTSKKSEKTYTKKGK